jgi:hypothetical protein
MEAIAGPFIGTEAVAAGLATRRQLKSRYVAVYRNVYLAKGIELTACSRAKAAWLWSGRAATLAGLSAAAVYGSRWIDPGLPAELIRTGDEVDGIVIHRDKLAASEICVVDGMPTSTPARAGYDIGRRADLTPAVIRRDALARATGVCRKDVDTVLARHRGARGVVQLREALDLMDAGAESPQETRTRLLLVRRGLPTPQTQIAVFDDFGYRFARIDMGWEEWKVGVEYDGSQHWLDPAQRTWDIDRWAKLEANGWTIIRVSGELLRYRPDVVVERVVDALRRAGWRGEIGVNARQTLKNAS